MPTNNSINTNNPYILQNNNIVPINNKQQNNTTPQTNNRQNPSGSSRNQGMSTPNQQINFPATNRTLQDPSTQGPATNMTNQNSGARSSSVGSMIDLTT